MASCATAGPSTHRLARHSAGPDLLRPVFPDHPCHDGHMRAGIVVNPRAGKGGAPELAERAAEELSTVGVRAELAHTLCDGDATKLARDMAAAGCDLVFAAGGDGTMNEVVQGIIDTGALLGVVPAGLANVWAADVDMSARPGVFA